MRQMVLAQRDADACGYLENFRGPIQLYMLDKGGVSTTFVGWRIAQCGVKIAVDTLIPMSCLFAFFIDFAPLR